MTSINRQMLVQTLFKFPFYIVTHPFKGFDDMKTEGKHRMFYSIVALVGLLIATIIKQAYLGFAVTGIYSQTPNINIIWTLVVVYGPIILFVVANWSITSITEGKGTAKEIFYTYCYSLYLNIFCILIATFLSQFVTLNEVAFATFFITFGQASSLFYLFIGLIIIHEYTFSKAVLMVVMTILSMMVITFIGALFFSLLNNVFNFFYIIFSELHAHYFTGR